MTCPKCGKDVCVLVTTEAKKKVREQHGLLVRIITFPFRLLGFLWRFLFGRRREKYYKKQHWHCNYCNHDWNPTV